MNLNEIREEYGINPQCVKNAIHKQRLKAKKVNGRWMIKETDLHHYLDNRHSRKLSRINGALIFDKEKGEYSVNEASNILKCNPQHVYYACQSKKIKCSKKSKAWVIKLDDIERYKKVMKIGTPKDFGNNSLKALATFQYDLFTRMY